MPTPSQMPSPLLTTTPPRALSFLQPPKLGGSGPFSFYMPPSTCSLPAWIPGVLPLTPHGTGCLTLGP